MELFSRALDSQCKDTRQVGSAVWSTTNSTSKPHCIFLDFLVCMCVQWDDCLPLLYYYNSKASQVNGNRRLSF